MRLVFIRIVTGLAQLYAVCFLLKCHWHGSTLELVCFNSFEFVTDLAQLYVVCFRSILSLVWLSSLQFVFNRSCHWLGSALCRLLQSILPLVWLSSLQFVFNRYCHWFGSALCSLLSIDLASGLAQLSVGCFQSILPLFWFSFLLVTVNRCCQ
jgi:hypothetical protein